MLLRRGEVYRVRLNPTEGREQQGAARPCVIVHRESLRNAGTALVVPLTTQPPKAGFPLTVHLPAGVGGNGLECRAKVTQLRVVSEARFVEPRVGKLSEAELEPIKEALRLVLDV